MTGLKFSVHLYRASQVLSTIQVVLHYAPNVQKQF